MAGGLLIALAAQLAADAQVPASTLDRELFEKAGFTAEERDRVRRGEPVVRAVAMKSDGDLSIVGAVRVNAAEKFSLDSFRRSLSQKSDKTRAAGDSFSNPPVLSDLEALELAKADYEDIAECRAADCDLNLPAEELGKLAAIDWSGPNRRTVADDFVKRFLLDYATVYLARGDAALRPYANRRKVVDLARAHRDFLADALLAGAVAPEFLEYVRRFPAAERAGTVSELRWSIVDFGLDPAIVLTHTVAGTAAGGHQIVINKQIYSSRYLDTSLSVAMLVTVAEESGPATYVVFTDRSRTDALGGPFGSLARKMVEKEATERVARILDRSGLALIAETRPLAPSQEPTTRPVAVYVAASVLALLAVYVLLRRVRK